MEGAFDILRQEWLLAQDNLEAALKRLRLAQVNIDEANARLLTFIQILLVQKTILQSFGEHRQYFGRCRKKSIRLPAHAPPDLAGSGFSKTCSTAGIS